MLCRFSWWFLPSTDTTASVTCLLITTDCDTTVCRRVGTMRLFFNKSTRMCPQAQSRITNVIKLFFYTIFICSGVPTVFECLDFVDSFHFFQVSIIVSNRFNLPLGQFTRTIRDRKSSFGTTMYQMCHRGQITFQLFITFHCLHNVRRSDISNLSNKQVNAFILTKGFNPRSQNNEFSSILNCHSCTVNGFVSQPGRMVLFIEIHDNLLGRCFQQIEINLE
mmetsp:Transcript_5651/g.8762  ORF Transcript_5651/g.8762 Transcript_5651/m.8762 type:complete len:221 (+) Transcript_5651:611-1273(+)